MVKGKGLSKRERKELNKKKRIEQSEKARSKREMEERRGKIIKFGAIALVLIAAGYFIFGGDAGVSDGPLISIEPLNYNFGDVSVAGGVVKTVMTIQNNGGSDLVINDMETSCGCTSATVEKNSNEGPAYGMKMHGNPTGWSETLKAGETALLNVYYDPVVHPDLRGQVTRSIAVYSNDKSSPAEEILIQVNQVA